MTETKERVIAALKDKLVTTRYPKVTVNELCLRARISRNTFYANFEDMDESFAWSSSPPYCNPFATSIVCSTSATLNLSWNA